MDRKLAQDRDCEEYTVVDVRCRSWLAWWQTTRLAGQDWQLQSLLPAPVAAVEAIL